MTPLDKTARQVAREKALAFLWGGLITMAAFVGWGVALGIALSREAPSPDPEQVPAVLPDGRGESAVHG